MFLEKLLVLHDEQRQRGKADLLGQPHLSEAGERAPARARNATASAATERRNDTRSLLLRK